MNIKYLSVFQLQIFQGTRCHHLSYALSWPSVLRRDKSKNAYNLLKTFFLLDPRFCLIEWQFIKTMSHTLSLKYDPFLLDDLSKKFQYYILPTGGCFLIHYATLINFSGLFEINHILICLVSVFFST